MPEDLVTIATFLTLPEAQAAKMHLESQGISAFLADAEIVSMDWLMGIAVGNIKLQVPTNQLEAAESLLDDINAKRKLQADSAKGSEKNICLACGADLPEETLECASCGWSFARFEDDDSQSE